MVPLNVYNQISKAVKQTVRNLTFPAQANKRQKNTNCSGSSVYLSPALPSLCTLAGVHAISVYVLQEHLIISATT